MGGPVLGRADELRDVLAVVDDGRPSARGVVLCGEAGIGKTTIWRAAVRHARERGLRVLVAQPTQTESALPYAALGDLFDAVDDHVDALPTGQRNAVEAALARTTTAGPLDQHARARGVLGVLSALGSDGPVVVAVDDVQWLDAPTGAALAFALRRLEPAPVRVLLSLRTTGGTSPDAALGLETWEEAPRRLEVGPLDRTVALLGLRSLRPAIKAVLHRRVHRVAAKRPQAACRALHAYVAMVKRAPRQAFTPRERTELVADARRVEAVLGC